MAAQPAVACTQATSNAALLRKRADASVASRDSVNGGYGDTLVRS